MKATFCSFILVTAFCLMRLTTQLADNTLQIYCVSLCSNLAFFCTQIVYLSKAKQIELHHHKAPFRVYSIILIYIVYATLGVSTSHIESMTLVSLSIAEYPSVNIIIMFLVECLFSVMTEELLFRKIVLSSLLASGKCESFAILIANCLFAIAHISNIYTYSLPAVLLQIAYCFFLGLLCSALYLRSGKILLPVLFHFFNNLLARYPDELLIVNSRFFSSANETPSFSYSSMIVALIYGLLSIVILYRFPRNRRDDRTQ